jgi:spectinomycin phosphotransferase
MDKEPAIGTENLIKTIQEEYGLEVAALRFLLRGWGGDCYLAETRSGTHYFLKLHDPDNYIGVAALSMDFYLPLIDQLHGKGILPQIPHPLPTRNGAFYLNVGPQVLVITNYIEGEDVGFGKISKPILMKLADMVGILHSSTPRLKFEHPFIEKYETSFVPKLMKSLNELEGVQPGVRPGVQLLRESIQPWIEQLNKYIDWLLSLQIQVKSEDKSMVVCHTDLHGGNLRQDDQGNLYLLDWENAMIAPQEHDMIFFTGDAETWDTFWQIYRGHFDLISLDSDTLAFYFYRRGLEDVAGLVFRIMAGDGDDAQDRSNVDWLVDCLEGLTNVEDTVAKILENSD